MLAETVYWIINMSITASLMGLCVLLIRRIRRIPRRVSVFLWIIPFFRMCVPIAFTSPFSFMNLISEYVYKPKTVAVSPPQSFISMSFMNSIGAAASYDPIVYKTNMLEEVFRVAGIIWLVVTLAILLAFTMMYVSTLKEIRDARRFKDNVYVSKKIDTPAVYGIIRPRIILPKDCKGKKREFVLRHERTHVRRKDNLWRLLGFLAASVHWFNPLSWLFLKAFLADLELACDETAVAKLSEDDRKEYAVSLIGSVRSKNMFVSAFGGAKVRTRIENLVSYRHLTVFSAAGFGLLVAAIIYVLITNAA
ncbi:MAG: M56 family metallopeptidase [Lachnospiraceae bacterium]|nr:M56 family metallopeptidase [Lachnospiraceae bacterium]